MRDVKGLKKAFDFVREGDTLVVWRLNRLGRSFKDLIALFEELENRARLGSAHFKRISIQEIEVGRSLAENTEQSVTSICQHLGISRPTYYRYIDPQVGIGIEPEK